MSWWVIRAWLDVCHGYTRSCPVGLRALVPNTDTERKQRGITEAEMCITGRCTYCAPYKEHLWCHIKNVFKQSGDQWESSAETVIKWDVWAMYEKPNIILLRRQGWLYFGTHREATTNLLTVPNKVIQVCCRSSWEDVLCKQLCCKTPTRSRKDTSTSDVLVSSN